MPEEEAKSIIKQSLQAIKHLHGLEIAHRDLKPENILFVDKDKIIKLIDFGMSKICKDEKALMNTKLGTPYYVSPEVLDGKYDKRTDNWSIGVIAFFLLCGEPPFNGDTTAAIFNKIKTCDYDFKQKIWKTISPEAKNFIEKMIEPNL